MSKLKSYATGLAILFAFSCSDDSSLKPEDQNQVSTTTSSSRVGCGTDKAMEEYYLKNPNARIENENFELFTAKHVEKTLNSARVAAPPYVIPVVFHVYGNDFSGRVVNDAIITRALQEVNTDFHGLNDDWNDINPLFDGRKATLDITFRLARIDPNGNRTTGIVYHPVRNGFGNTDQATLDLIAADAWDNLRYMNVYIQSDLYANGNLNESGIAWYPDLAMSNARTARVVYNGRFLFGNTDKEFASVLTHEFGHFFNLRHTFQGGCAAANERRCGATGDLVCDTPQATIFDNCNTRNNCAGQRVNTENYMGYAGAGGCYKMFTAGQVARMDAATNHAARTTLWQRANLIATGVF